MQQHIDIHMHVHMHADLLLFLLLQKEKDVGHSTNAHHCDVDSESVTAWTKVFYICRPIVCNMNLIQCVGHECHYSLFSFLSRGLSIFLQMTRFLVNHAQNVYIAEAWKEIPSGSRIHITLQYTLNYRLSGFLVVFFCIVSIHWLFITIIIITSCLFFL